MDKLLTPRYFAWEFLRRNPLYRKYAYCRSVSPSNNDVFPQSWGLLRYEDPNISALKADVFWSERAYSSLLQASVTDVTSSVATCIVIPDQNNFGLSVCHDHQGRSHYLFKTETGHFQIMLLNTKTFKHGHALLFHLPWFGHFQTHMETIQNFIAAVDKRRSDHISLPIKKSTFSIHNRKIQLMALDGYLAGKSLREIAKDIYVKEQVNKEWNDPRQHMKDRLRKIIKRALVLMNGGYLDLLRPPRDRIDSKRYTTKNRNFI